MNDDELRASLVRRASAPLSADERNNILRAARVAAVAPRKRTVPRLAGFLVGTAAVLVLVLISLPILLSPPSVAAPSPSNSLSAYPNVIVRTEADVIAAANDPSWVGRTVVARATIEALPSPFFGPACLIARPCAVGTMGIGPDEILVSAGYRDGTENDGELFHTDLGDQWLTKIAVPIGSDELSVFQIGDGGVDYLGPAKLTSEGAALSVGDVLNQNEKVPTGNVYIVDGYWSDGFWPTCPASATPHPDLSFFCQGSWLTDGPVTEPDIHTSVPNSLELSAGPTPTTDAAGRSILVVQSAGCQQTLEYNCPVWRVLGRLDTTPGPIAESTTPGPSTQNLTSNPPATALPIVNAQGLVNLVGDPSWVGKSVLAELPAGAIQHDPCASPLGTPLISCNLGTIGNVHGPYASVTVGLRDSTPEEGVQSDSGNGYVWVTPLAWPSDAGVYAFTVGSKDLAYLGPAQLATDGLSLAVRDVLTTSTQPTDDVFVVNGWLGTTMPAPCAYPLQGEESPRPDTTSYYCGGSWLAGHPWDPPTSGLTVADGLHVQGDAYSMFAPNAVEAMGEPGSSRQGTYLVRNAGCPEVVTGDCPVWRMVGRLDGGETTPPPSMVPSTVSPPPTEGGFTTANLGNVSFDYPNSWRLNPINEVNRYGAILGFVTSEAASAASSCPPNYSPDMGGQCTHTYSVPESSMLIRIDRYSLPSHGIETVACDLGAGGTPVEIGGMSGVTIDPFKESDLPAAGHAQAWRVAAPGDSVSNYSIYVADNGYPNDDTIVDRLLSTFRINSPGDLPSSIDEFRARNIALSYYFCAHDPAEYGGSSDNPTIQMGTDSNTGRPAWIVAVSDVVTKPDATPFESTIVLYIDAQSGAVRLDSKN